MNMKCSSLFNSLLSYAKISSLIVLLFSGLAVAIDFEEYDDDVAALLREYQSHSDSKGSYNPSVLSFNETEEANTLVDFENGLVFLTAITPETLKQSIIDVLLTQIDPSVIDAKSAQDFGLVNETTNKPFFWGQVLDHKGRPIQARRAAAEFADVLLRQKSFEAGRFSVSINMVETHKDIAGSKYVKYAQKASRQHNVSVSLMMAIMETESSFNPLARSRSNALGLMQIKADTAGRDYFSLIKGYKHTPSSDFLYRPENNIEVAAGYLNILSNRYLVGIRDPKKLEYAIISSYNGGAGNLWRSLNKKGNKTKAIARINKMSTKDFYWFLTNRHIRKETRNYVKKVSGKKRKYVNL
jgi:membrane-bound lytic murein transglycosylase C